MMALVITLLRLYFLQQHATGLGLLYYQIDYQACSSLIILI